MLRKFVRGAITIKTVVMVAVLCVVFVLSLAFGASAFGLTQEGEAAPSYEQDANGQLSGCNIPSDYQQVFNDATKGYNVSPALIAAIFYAGEHGKSWPSINGPWASSDKGAKGPFQFLDDTWSQYGMGGNIQDINDAAKAAANMFNKNIAAGNGDLEHKIKNAIKNYNHSDDYVNAVYDQYVKFSKCLETDQAGLNKADKYFNQGKWQSSWVNNKEKVKETMKPTGIVLHWTAGNDVASAISTMTSRRCYVHLIADKDGTVYQLMPFDSKVTCGSERGNSFAIAMEIVSVASSDIQANEDALMNNQKQFDGVVKAVQHLMDTYNIANIKGDNDTQVDAKEGIFGHYQVSTSGKQDPSKDYMQKIWDTLGSKEG